MSTKTSFLEEKLLPIANKFSKQRHLKAIRDAFITLMPITLAGGIVSVISAAPVTETTTNGFLLAWGNFAANNSMILSWLGMVTINSMSLYACIGIAYYLAKAYKMDTLLPCLLSVCGFMMTCVTPIELGWAGSSAEISYLGGQGLLPAIAISLLSVEAYHKMKSSHFGAIKLPDSVPASLSETFAAIIPGLIILTVDAIIFILCYSNGTSLPGFIYKLLSPALDAADSLGFAAFATFTIASFWFFGIHDAAFAGVLAPIRDGGTSLNAAAKLAGQALPRVLTTPFWVYYCAGGLSVFAFALLLIRSKSKQLKTVGRIGVVPAFFGISEPIVFGVPVMLNPIFFIPYTLTSTVNCIVAYLLTSSGVIAKSFANLSWNMPPVLGAGLSSMDWKASALVVILTVVNMAMYLPFIKVYEKELLKEEAE